jgi:hypothetical protein
MGQIIVLFALLVMLPCANTLAWLGRAMPKISKAKTIAGRQNGKEKQRSRIGSR